jgi:hypothetical protein
MGPISWLLGIKVTRDRKLRTLSLSQTSYIESIVRRFNFDDLKPISTPLDPLDNILVRSGRQHMHSIDVGFGKDRGGSGDDWLDEDLMSLAQLADMVSFSIPVTILGHQKH